MSSGTSPDQSSPLEWREWLSAGGLSEASVRGFCRDAKTIFREAAERELIRKSPFRNLDSASVASEEPHYVPLEVAMKFLAACPSLEWRVLFALARLEGLRVPSESHLLTWPCVDWESRELTVRSPKTERFKGKALRIVPLCPLMLDLLRQAYDAAPDKAGSVVTVKADNRDVSLSVSSSGPGSRRGCGSSRTCAAVARSNG